MDEDEIQECVDEVMETVHDSAAYDSKTVSKATTRAFLKALIADVQSEIEMLGPVENDDDEGEDDDEG